MASGVCRIAYKVRCIRVPGMASCHAAGTSHKALMALLLQTSMLGRCIQKDMRIFQLRRPASATSHSHALYSHILEQRCMMTLRL